ncbi:calcium-binding protein [Inquilinus sp. CA228]|uniref:calcium-binding protein n=1 Tax=Inquilinus sp. CA228 TaxID=3455609 RepID=UPI003F8D64C1
MTATSTTTNGSDIIIGTPGDDTIDAGGGNDVVSGGGGNDTIDGGSGFDVITGGAGNDVIDGSEGFDVIDGGDDNDWVRGGEGADVITGGAGRDKISGGDGADVLDGGAGNDLLRGGAGADILSGGDGIDVASYAESGAAVSINLATHVNHGGNAEGDVISGDIEAIHGSRFGDTLTGDGGGNTLRGLAGDDTLTGAGGDDRLVGGAGADRIEGGTGADTLLGDDGADRFVYAAAGDTGTGFDTRDIMVDFSSTDGDKIDLAGIDADGNAGNGDTAFSFIGGAAFSGQAGELRFVNDGVVSVVIADIDGDRQADLSIALIGSGLTLTAGDFVL